MPDATDTAFARPRPPTMTLETLFDLPRRTDPALQQRVQHRLDHLTKPLGALGRLEALALQVALL